MHGIPAASVVGSSRWGVFDNIPNAICLDSSDTESTSFNIPFSTCPSAPVEAGDCKDVKNARRTTERTIEDVWSRVRRGIDLALSFRRSGTPEEVRNVPFFSGRDRNYVPPRAEFLRHHMKLLAFCYLTLDFLGFSADPETNAMFFAPGKIPFFARAAQICGAELAMRISGTLGSGLGVFCSQQGVYSIMALLLVGLGVSEPRYRRSLFGSITKAYTLRRFWR